ncbi:methionine biosynthesis PLP-dependent protein [Aureibacillus halotolerans]|uniref:Cysteine synthase /cystathionine gamma-synthase n=1 Tax=Aureibacillus halotolerans TaxID=1508390 RepID=A0A4R6UAL4_9BACI|nr:methionine biosynthesis PLP-dependent protein [Aureibacillus halotolerans]TDQ42093.1 cysteine synthase /cystathionine gamma-synthase [Aureibacillus halotolerans]
MTEQRIDTLFAQIGNRTDTETGTVSPAIYLSTAFRHNGIGESTGYDYTRTKNPTRHVLEEAIATLEGGVKGLAFSSGMAAVNAVMTMFSSGDELIVSQDLYGGTYRLFDVYGQTNGLTFSYVHTHIIEDVEKAITSKTKALFIETPTNPLMHESDLDALGKLAKDHDLLLIVDNTFLTPYLQRPHEIGADIVIHSATKYLGGHNDVLAGLLTTKDVALGEKLATYQNAAGAVLSPFDSWLLMRGMKTLPLRMRQHTTNATALAAFLEQHDLVDDVLYANRGGMLSFRLTSEALVPHFLKALKLICFAESLGGVESFITYPATQTHMDIPEEIRTAYGVCNRLLRFSVGIEDAEDLIHDVDQALHVAATHQEEALR